MYNTKIMQETFFSINVELAVHDIIQAGGSSLSCDAKRDIIFSYFKDPDEAEKAFSLIEEIS